MKFYLKFISAQVCSCHEIAYKHLKMMYKLFYTKKSGVWVCTIAHDIICSLKNKRMGIAYAESLFQQLFTSLCYNIRQLFSKIRPRLEFYQLCLLNHRFSVWCEMINSIFSLSKIFARLRRVQCALTTVNHSTIKHYSHYRQETNH